MFKTLRRAKFPATKSIPGDMDAYFGVRKTDGPGQMVKTKIVDKYGHPVGEYLGMLQSVLETKTTKNRWSETFSTWQAMLGVEKGARPCTYTKPN